jgi:hypothetical protein
VAGLSKRFGTTAAVDGLSFTASYGRITGFLGPTAPEARNGIVRKRRDKPAWRRRWKSSTSKG